MPSLVPDPSFYRRNLPHWQPEGSPIFLTWRLHNSLPPQYRTARNGCATRTSPGRECKRIDAILDKSNYGPRWLRDPRIARVILSCILKGSMKLNYFALHAFVVMPNHVHLLIAPKCPVRRITNGLKGASAHESNAILDRVGRPFWQDESYDHWVRTPQEFGRICSYIELNPVSANLVKYPQQWPWSSASINLDSLAIVQSPSKLP